MKQISISVITASILVLLSLCSSRLNATGSIQIVRAPEISESSPAKIQVFTSLDYDSMIVSIVEFNLGTTVLDTFAFDQNGTYVCTLPDSLSRFRIYAEFRSDSNEVLGSLRSSAFYSVGQQSSKITPIRRDSQTERILLDLR